MERKPSNTREQCAYDAGRNKAERHMSQGCFQSDLDTLRKSANPHKKGSKEWQFWNEGFDSLQDPV